MTPLPSQFSILTSSSLCLWCLAPLLAQAQSGDPTPFAEASSETAKATRDASSLYLEIQDDAAKMCSIPRLYAPLVSSVWQDTGESVQVTPEQQHWGIKWKRKAVKGKTIVLTFGTRPVMKEEQKPIRAQSDGSYYLPAHHADAFGEKIRYEPQSYKNTVGYWVGKKDYAVWKLKIEKAGRFNVSILQGCGKGQGGSQAEILFSSAAEDKVRKVEFEVLETGHFQDFRWRHLNSIELPAIEFEVRVQPKKIAKNALMDIRAIHLVRLPDPKK